MARHTGSGAEVRQLRALLTMSRELMQVDEPQAALALAGRAMSDLALVDNALLLVRGAGDSAMPTPCTMLVGVPSQHASAVTSSSLSRSTTRILA